MKSAKKGGHRTNDSVNVGVTVHRTKSNTAGKATPKVSHKGQPTTFGSMKATTSVPGKSNGKSVGHNGQPTPFGKVGKK